MSLGVSSVGINLVGANYVIFTGQAWNASTESQAVARAHRYGQNKKVTVFHIAYRGTIEQEQYKR